MTPTLRAELKRLRDNPSDEEIEAMAIAYWNGGNNQPPKWESLRKGLKEWIIADMKFARRALFDKLLKEE